MVNTQLLEKAIADSGKKKEFLAKRCDITRQSLTSKINNRSEFTGGQIMILCKELNITQLTRKDAIFFASNVEENGNAKKGET